jgi:3-mercaptopyruvate sulfurtransferase SseA
VLRKPHRLQDILFDDDAFSISKRYFWAINMVHEMINLLDDNIEKWAQYRRTAVTPFRQKMEAKVEEDWHEKAQATLVRAEKEATEACAELELIRRAFQEKLQRITVMRDGVSI